MFTDPVNKYGGGIVEAPHKGAGLRHSKDSTDRLFDYDLHLESRTLWVGATVLEDGSEAGVDAAMAETFIKGLHLLQYGAKAEEPITVKMTNPGGSWYYGMAMYDAIRNCRAPVTIEASGLCMSMGSIIIQAADHRLVHPNCRFMLHDGEEGYVGHARDFENWGKECKRIRGEMYAIYAERSGRPVGYWEKRCMFDLILTADQAVREGLADKVLPHVKQFGLQKKSIRKAKG